MINKRKGPLASSQQETEAFAPIACKKLKVASNYMCQPVHSEGDQPWDFFGRNDAKAETPVLWPSHAKS